LRSKGCSPNHLKERYMTTLKSVANSTFIFVAGILILFSSPAQAAKRAPSGHSPDLVVVRPADLPPSAQIGGQAMYLSSPGFAQYLYIEQNNGRHLAVLDVTDPAHTRAAAEVEIKSPPFAFVRDLDEESVLVRFIGSERPEEFGILDLRHARKPVLRPLDELSQARASAISDSGRLLFDAYLPSAGEANEFSYTVRSQPVVAINNIRREITDEETGRRFFLTSNGLWIVRQPQVERENEINQIPPRQP
jgi:hypothetical protein